MSGAYTAKPDVVTTPDVPPGWNVNWPFPGPFPPGFDPLNPELPGIPPEEPDPENPSESLPRIIVYPIEGLKTRESDDGLSSGELNSYFYIVLSSAPKKGAITVPIFTNDSSEGIPDGYYGGGAEFEFNNTEGDWNRPRLVQLCGVKDTIEDGDVPYIIQVGPSTSSHADYCDLYGHDVSVTNIETVWELLIEVSLQTSGSCTNSQPWQTGYAQEIGWFKVRGPGANPGWGSWAKSETKDYFYLHPTDGYSEVTETITGSPESFVAFSKTFVLAKTGVDGRFFRIEYQVNTSWGIGLPFIGESHGHSSAIMTIHATLFRDDVIQSEDEDTISANSPDTVLGNSDSDSGSMNFLTDEL